MKRARERERKSKKFVFTKMSKKISVQNCDACIKKSSGMIFYEDKNRSQHWQYHVETKAACGRLPSSSMAVRGLSVEEANTNTVKQIRVKNPKERLF